MENLRLGLVGAAQSCWLRSEMEHGGAVEGVTDAMWKSLSPSPKGAVESGKGAVTASEQGQGCLQQPQRMALFSRGFPFSAAEAAGIGIDKGEGKVARICTGLARIEHRQHVGQPAALVLAWRAIGSLKRSPATCARKLKAI